LRLFRSLREFDAVVLQRKLLARLEVHLLRRSVSRLIFDFDDAVFLRDSFSPKGLTSRRRDRRFTAQVREADAVVAGNTFLREQVLARSGSAKVDVVPTCVDAAGYPMAQHTRIATGVQLVWIGTASTLNGLKEIRAWLEEAGRRLPGLQLKLVSDRFLHLRYLQVVPSSWSEQTQAAELAAADIGMSWLPDDMWSRGKCGLKILQYMASGLPVVANPVGVQADMVEHGKTGFLAETAEQWFDAIERLVGDPALRRRMGLAGRRKVEAEFSLAQGALRWLALLNHLGATGEAA
jgi:glycosyltransferase involved in cell wall biosynthesis